MDTRAYFESLTIELSAVKDRIRNLIGNRYWPGDGQWKESVIRSVLRRYLPSSFAVGSGFVVSEDGISTQIDVLVYDGSGPVLFRDSDFVIATPDVVTAVIEVKTRVRPADARTIIEKLHNISELFRKRARWPKPFIGLFSFEDEPMPPEHFLDLLKEINGSFGSFEIQCAALGTSQFIRFWERPPAGPRRSYHKWHFYELDGTAPGYFIHNVVESLFPNSVFANNNLWYPEEGKEPKKIAEIGKDAHHTGQQIAEPDRP